MPARVAIIGTGPCGLSQLRAFERAGKEGSEASRDRLPSRSRATGAASGTTPGAPGSTNMASPSTAACIGISGRTGRRSAWSSPTTPSIATSSSRSRPIRRARCSTTTSPAGRRRPACADASASPRRCATSSSPTRPASSASPRNTCPTARTNTENFDFVIVATGHFSVPNVPHFEGVEKFPGRVMHAHDFRDAQEFSGKRLLIVGASYSAEDIALQCHKYGAKHVTMCWRTKPMGFHWPQGMDERPLLTKLVGKTAHFKDGSSQRGRRHHPVHRLPAPASRSWRRSSG